MTEAGTIDAARSVIAEAEALLITAGAGMGVDSGLPDFRGSEGFWKAYPPYRHLGFNFMEMANPRRFHDEPGLGWGFYGHRLHLYRDTRPHAGFGKLLAHATSLEDAGGWFVFTSNVDGHFQRAGFDADRVVECHGSINHLQCAGDCRGRIWSAKTIEVAIDEETMRALAPLPACLDCGGMARPNVLMFGDFGWNSRRTDERERRLTGWMRTLQGRRLAVLEFGAGTAVPTVRIRSEQIAARFPEATLIRVNPREPEVPEGISITAGARETIERLFA